MVVVIAILSTMILGTFGSLRARAEKANCVSNLKNLYYGASAYLQDQGHWPQVPSTLVAAGGNEYAKLWEAALQPYGLSRYSWVCPTQQRSLGNPNLSDSQNIRTDYDATPFDSSPHTPYRWSTQPWFVEHGSVHDGGPLLIFSSGQVESLNDVAPPLSGS